jgi:hypothetical protein
MIWIILIFVPTKLHISLIIYMHFFDVMNFVYNYKKHVSNLKYNQ